MIVKAGSAAQFLIDMGFTKADMAKMSDMFTDAEIDKAMPGSESDSMPMITDRWHKGQMHAVPSSEQIKVGPGQSASGGGAEHMVREYSNPAPQKGIQLEAERLEAELGPMRGYAKAIADGHNGLCASFDELSGIVKNVVDQNMRLKIVTAALIKAVEKGEDEEKGDDDKEEKFEINASKAQEAYAKARALLKKSRSIKAAMKAASDAGHIGALKAQSKLFKKAAQGYFNKAAEYSKAGGARAVVTRKALDEFFAANPALKSEEALDASALRKAAIKARKDWKAAVKSASEIKKDDDAGNQADEEKHENGNQADHAAKAEVEVMAKQVQDAVNGMAMLETTVKGLMETISNRPVNGKVEPLALVKADPEAQFRKLDATIEKWADENRLDTANEHRARDVVKMLSAVKAGSVTQAQFDAYQASLPQVVRECIASAA